MATFADLQHAVEVGASDAEVARIARQVCDERKWLPVARAMAPIIASVRARLTGDVLSDEEAVEFVMADYRRDGGPTEREYETYRDGDIQAVARVSRKHLRQLRRQRT